MRELHIAAGMLALVAGAMALCATKGSPLHRRSGMVFVVAMLVMSGSGALMAAFIKPNMVNVTAGLLTFYLVSTALLAVRRPVEQARGWLTGFMLAALMLGAFAFWLGFEALHSVNGRVDQVPAPPLFMFGVVGVMGGLLDARLLLAGNLQGAHRLARHLWRMGFAMFIATSSFFLGQAKFFPDVVRKSGLLAIPVLLVIGFVAYSLARVLWPKRKLPDVQPGQAA